MRIWYFSKTKGTMSGDWQMMGNTLKATGKPIQNGVEAVSLIWTPDKKVKCVPANQVHFSAGTACFTCTCRRMWDAWVPPGMHGMVVWRRHSGAECWSVWWCVRRLLAVLCAALQNSEAIPMQTCAQRQSCAPANSSRACRYMSVGYCVDRINSNTPNGTMLVAVPGLLRAANAEYLYKAFSKPPGSWLQQLGTRLMGKTPPGFKPYDRLPEWFKQLPDSNLRMGQNYNR